MNNIYELLQGGQHVTAIQEMVAAQQQAGPPAGVPPPQQWLSVPYIQSLETHPNYNPALPPEQIFHNAGPLELTLFSGVQVRCRCVMHPQYA